MEENKNIINKLETEKQSIKVEVKKKTLGYIVAALGLVAGLAWNDAIKSIIEYLFPLSKDTVLAKLIYAVLLTVVIVILTIIITKIFQKEGESKE